MSWNLSQLISDLEDAIAGRASDAVLERDIDGVKLKYTPVEKMLELRDRFLHLQSLENGEAPPLPGQIHLSFRG